MSSTEANDQVAELGVEAVGSVDLMLGPSDAAEAAGDPRQMYANPLASDRRTAPSQPLSCSDVLQGVVDRNDSERMMRQGSPLRCRTKSLLRGFLGRVGCRPNNTRGSKRIGFRRMPLYTVYE